MSNKHTQGDWIVIDVHNDTRTVDIKADNKIIATVWAFDNGKQIIDFYEQQANAKLIAAAPELLQALIEINSIIADASNTEGGKLNVGQLAKISIAAINKATY